MLACSIFAVAISSGSADAQSAPAGFVMISENASNTIAKIDWCTDTILGRANVGNTPSGMAVDHDRRWVYVAVNSTNVVAVVDADTMAVATLDVPELGYAPTGVALTPDRLKLLVTTRGRDGTPSYDDTLDVVALDRSSWPPSGTFVTNILTGSHPINVVVGHDGRLAVVTVRNEPDIIAVDLGTYQIVARDLSLPFDSEPEGSAIHPDTNVVYVTLHGQISAIEVLNLNTTTIVKRVSIQHFPAAQPSTGAFTPDGRRFYVSGQPIQELLMFDTSNPTNPVQDLGVQLAVGQEPHYVVFLPGGNKAYVANTGAEGPLRRSGLSVINNYTGTPSSAGQVLTNLAGPIRTAYLLPRPAIKEIRYEVNPTVTIETGTGLTYRVWSKDAAMTDTNWQMMSEFAAGTNQNAGFEDWGQNGRELPAIVTSRFYKCDVRWVR